MICYRTDVYTIFIELAYKKGYVFDSVVLDFTPVLWRRGA